jgi:UDP-2,3-diacylglucosamine pyrophosphatase LpxH
MIIVTDAHISKAAGNHATFFSMLESLEKNDQALIFLGDIFDLWVALPGYESDIHHDFIEWCREQKKHRTIGFMEGNREYYPATERGQAFSWCSTDAWYRDDSGTLFVHGDQINYRDRNYLAFRKLLKNRVAKLILNHLPWGPRIAEQCKQRLMQTNTDFRYHLPRREIRVFAESRFAEGVDSIFMGHFHQEYIYRNSNSKSLYALPDWFSTRKVTVFDQESKKAACLHWKQISESRKAAIAPRR